MNGLREVKGHLAVSPNHTLYFERIGNTNKPSIIFIHGGPGLGFSEKDKSLFDFEACNVIFYDQRGSGRSLFNSLLIDNTSTHQIEDIKHIFKKFSLDQAVLLGGSWGATLALLFTIKYPKLVSSLILRGTFLATKKARSYFELGNTKIKFPKVWKRFRNNFSNTPDNQVMTKYFDGIKKLDNENAKLLSLDLNLYGLSIANPDKDKSELIAEILKTDHLKKSKIMAHYSLNDFFIPENFIPNHLATIDNISIYMIHGIQDYITPISNVESLPSLHKNIKLIKTEEGHSALTPQNTLEIKRALQSALG